MSGSLCSVQYVQQVLISRREMGHKLSQKKDKSRNKMVGSSVCGGVGGVGGVDVKYYRSAETS